MSVSRKSLLQVLPLVLFLLARQLQAKTVSTCLMMNGDVHGATVDIQDIETCHHDDHKACLSLDYDDVASLDTDLCHIRIVVLGANQDVKLNTPVPDLVIESDIDPLQEKSITFPIFKLQATAFIHSSPRISYSQVGSKIHLITQRFRI